MIKLKTLHPIITFCYFLLIISISILTQNPIIIAISFLSSLILYVELKGYKELFKNILYTLPFILLLAITNPLFVHKGETILFFMNDNPITLEAILYGFNIAFMITSIIYWFASFNELFTSDKYIYLFGNIAPKFSILLSMTLRFIPLYIKKYKEINKAQKGLGIYISNSYFDRLKSKFRVLSILISWCLENSIETANSMNSRGYKLKGRVNYSNYKFTLSDAIILVAIIISIIVSIALYSLKYFDYKFYPIMQNINFNSLYIIIYVFIFSVFNLFSLLETKEKVLWQCLKLKI